MYPPRLLTAFAALLAVVGATAWRSDTGSAPPCDDDAPGALSDPAGAPAPPRAPPPASAFSREGFKLIAEQNGVRVYRRDVRPGIELAAQGDFAASPERVRRVLVDYPSHRRWQKHLKEVRVLARGDGFTDVYERLALPVIDDRDFTLHATWGEDGAILWMRFATANERGPAPAKGVVRVTDHDGGWRLVPTDDGQSTHAVFRFYIDLAGSLPAWLSQSQAASELPEIFGKIAEELPRYR